MRTGALQRVERSPVVVVDFRGYRTLYLQLLPVVPIPPSGDAVIEGTEVVCAKGAIATGPADAARIGARIFEQGGNAMDAAAAACLACTVLETSAVDLGGYVASAVVLDGKTGQVWSVDANS